MGRREIERLQYANLNKINPTYNRNKSLLTTGWQGQQFVIDPPLSYVSGFQPPNQIPLQAVLNYSSHYSDAAGSVYCGNRDYNSAKKARYYV